MEAFREGWDDPAMAAYDAMDPRLLGSLPAASMADIDGWLKAALAIS